jgi:hypothetical protein
MVADSIHENPLNSIEYAGWQCVIVEGLTGKLTDLMGVYEPIEKLVNDRPAYQFMGRADRFLYYVNHGVVTGRKQISRNGLVEREKVLERERSMMMRGSMIQADKPITGEWIVGTRKSMDASEAVGWISVFSHSVTPDAVCWDEHKPAEIWTLWDEHKWVESPELHAIPCSPKLRTYWERRLAETETTALQQAKKVGSLLFTGLDLNDHNYKLMGVYELRKGWVVSKRAVWQLEDSDENPRYLFYNDNHKWAVGSEDDMKSGSQGLLMNTSTALTPNKVTDAWVAWESRWNKWHQVPAAKVQKCDWAAKSDWLKKQVENERMIITKKAKAEEEGRRLTRQTMVGGRQATGHPGSLGNDLSTHAAMLNIARVTGINGMMPIAPRGVPGSGTIAMGGLAASPRARKITRVLSKRSPTQIQAVANAPCSYPRGMGDRDKEQVFVIIDGRPLGASLSGLMGVYRMCNDRWVNSRSVWEMVNGMDDEGGDHSNMSMSMSMAIDGEDMAVGKGPHVRAFLYYADASSTGGSEWAIGSEESMTSGSTTSAWMVVNSTAFTPDIINHDPDGMVFREEDPRREVWMVRDAAEQQWLLCRPIKACVCLEDQRRSWFAWKQQVHKRIREQTRTEKRRRILIDLDLDDENENSGTRGSPHGRNSVGSVATSFADGRSSGGMLSRIGSRGGARLEQERMRGGSHLPEPLRSSVGLYERVHATRMDETEHVGGGEGDCIWFNGRGVWRSKHRLDWFLYYNTANEWCLGTESSMLDEGTNASAMDDSDMSTSCWIKVPSDAFTPDQIKGKWMARASPIDPGTAAPKNVRVRQTFLEPKNGGGNGCSGMEAARGRKVRAGSTSVVGAAAGVIGVAWTPVEAPIAPSTVRVRCQSTGDRLQEQMEELVSRDAAEKETKEEQVAREQRWKSKQQELAHPQRAQGFGLGVGMAIDEEDECGLDEEGDEDEETYDGALEPILEYKQRLEVLDLQKRKQKLEELRHQQEQLQLSQELARREERIEQQRQAQIHQQQREIAQQREEVELAQKKVAEASREREKGARKRREQELVVLKKGGRVPYMREKQADFPGSVRMGGEGGSGRGGYYEEMRNGQIVVGRYEDENESLVQNSQSAASNSQLLALVDGPYRREDHELAIKLAKSSCGSIETWTRRLSVSANSKHGSQRLAARSPSPKNEIRLARLRGGVARDVDVGFSVMRMVMELQAAARKHSARREAVALAKKRGLMLALPGTKQGFSGWYEWSERDTRMVAKFQIDNSKGEAAPARLGIAVTGSEGWRLLQGPMQRRYYDEAVRLQKMALESYSDGNRARPTRTAPRSAPTAPAARRTSVTNVGLLVMRAVVRLQASVRRGRARRLALEHAERQGVGLLAMPGTVQGGSGWYQYREEGTDDHSGTPGAKNPGRDMLAQFHVYEDVDKCRYHLIQGPITPAQFHEAQLLKAKARALEAAGTTGGTTGNISQTKGSSPGGFTSSTESGNKSPPQKGYSPRRRVSFDSDEEFSCGTCLRRTCTCHEASDDGYSDLYGATRPSKKLGTKERRVTAYPGASKPPGYTISTKVSPTRRKSIDADGNSHAPASPDVQKLREIKFASMDAGSAPLALPGTTPGRSGWYQKGDQIFKYKVGEGTEWQVEDGPMDEISWLDLQREEGGSETKQEGGSETKQGESDSVDGRMSMHSDSDYGDHHEVAAVALQSAHRGAGGRQVARAQKLQQHTQRSGVALAMPGTVQGGSGWYQTIDGLVSKYAVENNNGQGWVWELLEGPLTEVQWRRRQAQEEQSAARSAVGFASGFASEFASDQTTGFKTTTAFPSGRRQQKMAGQRRRQTGFPGKQDPEGQR